MSVGEHATRTASGAGAATCWSTPRFNAHAPRGERRTFTFLSTRCAAEDCRPIHCLDLCRGTRSRELGPCEARFGQRTRLRLGFVERARHDPRGRDAQFALAHPYVRGRALHGCGDGRMAQPGSRALRACRGRPENLHANFATASSRLRACAAPASQSSATSRGRADPRRCRSRSPR